MAWEPIFFLPNVCFETSFENEKIAFTSARDARVGLHRDASPIQDFLSRFEDQHGRKITPSILWWMFEHNEDKPDYEALANFRDLISISCVSWGWTKKINNPQFGQLIFSDYLSFYPWYIAYNNTEYIQANLPFKVSVHDLCSFRGQSTPGLSQIILNVCDYDKPLFAALEACWRERWLHKSEDWKYRALFRSLNMAHAASMMPTGTQPAIIYDFGRMLALWVSAFEIIARENEDDDTGFKSVYELLEKVSYISEPQIYPTYMGKTKNNEVKTDNKIFPCYLYGELNKIRNDFIHGRKLSGNKLILGDYPLIAFAAPLYSLALRGFLNLKFNILDYAWFAQRQIEAALSKAKPKVE